MKHHFLGRTGVRVSPLCFGTMSFGGDADREASSAMYAACRDRGINFFDCANAYQKGAAEQILGELIAGDRDELVITTKFWNPMGPDVNAQGTSRRHLAQAVEASLRRLKTDRIDVYFIHHWDDNTPLEDTLRGLEDLITSGKVLYLGASNFAAWQIAKALGIADRRGWSRLDIIQPMYNLVKRQAEVEMFPLAQAEGLGVMTYSPLGGGLLSGKYREALAVDTSRLIADAKYGVRYGETWARDTAAKFASLAEAKGVHPATLAVAWAASHPAVTTPIIGARNIQQLTPSLAALDYSMSPDEYAEITALSRTPPLATDRRDEQEGFPPTKH